MKKALKWIVIVVLLLIVVAVVVVVMNLNSIIKSTVQTQASKQLNVTTTLDSANLSLLGGNLSLDDFKIGSPKGFTAPEMFSLGKADVKVSYGQLRQDPIRVNLISLDKPKLVIEEANRSINFKALVDQMEKGEPAPQPTEADPAGKPVKLIIDQLNINGTQVVVKSGTFGKEYTLTLPNFSMANIGNDENAQNGAAIKDVVTQVIRGITEKTADSEQLSPELRAILKGDLSAVTDALKNQATARVNQELGKLDEKIGINTTQAVDTLKSGNKEELQKTGTDLLKGVLNNREKKAPTTTPAK